MTATPAASFVFLNKDERSKRVYDCQLISKFDYLFFAARAAAHVDEKVAEQAEGLSKANPILKDLNGSRGTFF